MLNDIHKNIHRSHAHRIFYNFKHLEIDQSIFNCTLLDACTPQIILPLWEFLYIREAGRRGNKITDYSTLTLHSSLFQAFR